MPFININIRAVPIKIGRGGWPGHFLGGGGGGGCSSEFGSWEEGGLS